ncbi:MAG: MaoC family dehydratase N-terminal domain-containing protein [Acidimicrobiia bacterium]|nr:MaoC family dehydratase N-terminal domain-containing protein [Acidimicrobiia bacterium]
MSGPGVVLGRRLGPFPGRLDADLVRAYAQATADPNAGPVAGSAVPPVAIVTQIWEAQSAAFAELVPQAVKGTMSGGVHGEHDVVLHRPIVPGEELQTWVEATGCRRGGRHAIVTMHYGTHDSEGELVAEQWWTTVLLGATAEPVGEPAPAHKVGADVVLQPVGDHVVTVDEDMPRRYAEVSGDWSEHHFDVEAARRTGFDRPFLHGLATMALCAQGVVALAAGGDPDRVRRVAVRFAAPTFVGEDVTVHVARADDRTITFTAESAGATVITDGLAELRF